MKNRKFSKELYFDALKQTRILGILVLAVSVFLSIQEPITMLFSQDKYKSIVYLKDIAPTLYILPYLIAPLFSFILFGFMNKRNASDFYHSVAYTRKCIFLSFFAAVCTWIVLIMALTLFPSLLLHTILDKYYVINYAKMFTVALGILSSSVFSAATVIIAISLTGTLFTNVITSLLILLAPDYLLTATLLSVMELIPVMPTVNTWSKYTPAGFDLFNTATNSYEGISLFENLFQNVFTIFLAVAAIFIALVLFNRRKSETATYPLQSRGLKAALKIAAAFMVSAVATVFIFRFIFDFTTYSAREYYILGIIYVGAIIVYMAMELIISRSFKSIVATLPGLLVVLVLNVALFGAMFTIYSTSISFTPDADEIDYIRIPCSDYNSNTLSAYLDKKGEDIKLTDDGLKTLVADTLKSDIEGIKNKSYYESSKETYTYKKVIVSVNGIERARNIKVSLSKLETIAQCLKENKDYQRAYLDIPELSDISVLYCDALEEKDVRDLYSVMYDEISELDFESWYAIVNSMTYMYDHGYISLSSRIGTEYYSFDMPITMKLRKSAIMYFSLYSDSELSEKILSSEDLSWIDEAGITVIADYRYDITLSEDTDIEEFVSKLSPFKNCGTDDIIIKFTANTLRKDEYGEWYESELCYFIYDGDLNELLERFSQTDVFYQYAD